MCEYESIPSRNEEVMAKVKYFDNFYKYLTLGKGQPEGQCQVWVWLCEALMTRSTVCEYERNKFFGQTDGRTYSCTGTCVVLAFRVAPHFFLIQYIFKGSSTSVIHSTSVNINGQKQ